MPIYSKNNIRNRGSEDGEGLHIYCEADAIPVAAPDAFENSDLSGVTLHVADELVASYKATAPWSGFGKIVGLTNTGITTQFGESPNQRIFDLQGNRVDKFRKGVNIIKPSDGQTRKVVIK